MTHTKTTDRAAVLASFLSIDVHDVQEATYGDHTYEADGEEWLVLTDEEADTAAREYIRESVWAFRPEFVASYTVGHSSERAIRVVQEACCEDANPLILAAIGDRFDDFAADAIGADGRGHFLSHYDGEEHEAGDFFLYRVG